MKRCVYCGIENADSNKYCINCGEELSDYHKNNNYDSHIKQEVIDGPIDIKDTHDNNIRCPNCNSKKIAYLTKSTDGFSGSNAC
ncbi:MAG: zinc ribbon domain-containing protein, partial [Candidatus Izimaplasma sp.]|nr:zinc ribbon domain-containing protein [Candidatus Izimaplasma bacterium]